MNQRMVQTREDVDAQLKALGRFDAVYTGRELKHLPQLLDADERIHGLTSGMHERTTWLITVTDRRLVLLDKGMFYGLKQLELPYRQITSVAQERGFFLGFIEVGTASKVFKIDNITNRDVERIAKLIMDLVGRHQTGGSRPSAPPVGGPGATSGALLTELERLVVLKTQGFFDEEEFAAAKRRLLGLAQEG